MLGILRLGNEHGHSLSHTQTYKHTHTSASKAFENFLSCLYLVNAILILNLILVLGILKLILVLGILSTNNLEEKKERLCLGTFTKQWHNKKSTFEIAKSQCPSTCTI